jgi:hypothetical protein
MQRQICAGGRLSRDCPPKLNEREDDSNVISTNITLDIVHDDSKFLSGTYPDKINGQETQKDYRNQED